VVVVVQELLVVPLLLIMFLVMVGLEQFHLLLAQVCIGVAVAVVVVKTELLEMAVWVVAVVVLAGMVELLEQVVVLRLILGVMVNLVLELTLTYEVVMVVQTQVAVAVAWVSLFIQVVQAVLELLWFLTQHHIKMLQQLAHSLKHYLVAIKFIHSLVLEP
jgi:hypothetical protein